MNVKQVQRGYFGIGIVNGKVENNIGTLWRGAYQLGAAYIFTIGERYKRQPTDTSKTLRHIPLFSYQTFDEFMRALPYGSILVAVENGHAGVPLPEYEHPKRAVYLLGAEDKGLPKQILTQCHNCTLIPSVRQASYNVAQAGTLVMYDRMIKMSKTVIEL